MSLASPVDADYITVINTLRGHIAKGTQPNDYDMRLAIAVIKNAISRFDACNTAVAAVVADIEILDAAACAANAGADAAAVIATAVTDLEAAAITEPAYVTSVVADG